MHQHMCRYKESCAADMTGPDRAEPATDSQAGGDHGSTIGDGSNVVAFLCTKFD